MQILYKNSNNDTILQWNFSGKHIANSQILEQAKHKNCLLRQ